MLPNTTYLIWRGGKGLSRAGWTDPLTIEAILDYLLAARARRREGLRLALFYAEFVGYRWSDRAKFRKGPARVGQQAIDDHARATRCRMRRGPRPGQIELDE